MRIAVLYASRYGATAGIAERIAERLDFHGHDATVLPAAEARELPGYDAFVIGSAVYFGRWLGPATELVRRHASLLSQKPVWLFSSGPLGSAATDEDGRELRDQAVPPEIEDHQQALKARGHRVFFGALRQDQLGFWARLLRKLPAARRLLPEGDFRDWADIEAWADGIAQALAPARPPAPRPSAGLQPPA